MLVYHAPLSLSTKLDSMIVLLSGDGEGPPRIFFNIMLSDTDDLVTRPYEIATIAISY